MVRTQYKTSFFFILIVIFGFMMWFHSFVLNTEETLYQKVQENLIQDIRAVAIHFEKTLLKIKSTNNNSLFRLLQKNPIIRTDLENKMKFALSSKIKYLYLLYKDKNGKFRFLLDASDTDKAIFNEKFDAENDLYNKIYNTKKEIVSIQDSLKSLSITYLYPILINNNVEAILVFDFASDLTHNIEKTISPVKKIFTIVYILIIIFMIVSLIQAYIYYKTRKESYIDPLTGVYNRLYLRKYLETIDLDNYSLCIVDFDYFKKINDTYGHNIGDEVLKSGAKLMLEALGENDKIFRYGGEEFILLVKKNTNEEDTNHCISNKIRQDIENFCFKKDKVELSFTVSIGVNNHPKYSKNIGDAIKIADMMLYKAKTQGRNRVVIYSENIIVEEKSSANDTIEKVKSALEADRIVCHFHKIVNQDMHAYKYEALVRYIDKEGNLTFPNHFLPAIEHTQIYTDVAKRVVDISIAKIIQEDVSISVNFNANDILNKVLMDYVMKAIQKLKNKSLFSIELLESQSVENLEELTKVIKQFHFEGIQFSIDDFGSGYANFNYLVDLDVDYLKIDGSLVKNVASSEKYRNIVKAIIELAHSIGLKTIAEFVVNDDVIAELKSLGIDYMQGFHIAKPSEFIY